MDDPFKSRRRRTSGSLEAVRNRFNSGYLDQHIAIQGLTATSDLDFCRGDGDPSLFLQGCTNEESFLFPLRCLASRATLVRSPTASAFFVLPTAPSTVPGSPHGRSD